MFETQEMIHAAHRGMVVTDIQLHYCSRCGNFQKGAKNNVESYMLCLRCSGKMIKLGSLQEHIENTRQVKP